MGQSRSNSEPSDPDEEGSVKFRIGDVIRKDRFEIKDVAGKGTFGTVLECHDKKHDEDVALKVVRSVKRYIEAAYVEVDILDKIRRTKASKKSLCVRMLGAFTTHIRGQKHVCISFEKLGTSVYEFIKANKYRGYPVDHVIQMGYQLAHSVAFLHAMHLTHTDLKPENILLKNDDYYKQDHDKHGPDYRIPVSSEIRLIDFGGATFANDHHSSMINTRQ